MKQLDVYKATLDRCYRAFTELFGERMESCLDEDTWHCLDRLHEDITVLLADEYDYIGMIREESLVNEKGQPQHFQTITQITI